MIRAQPIKKSGSSCEGSDGYKRQLVAYLATWIGGMFGYRIPYIHDNGIIGIGFSLFVVGVASFSFILDFAQVERHVYEQSPKYMEWYLGYCLMVTVVWLYFESVYMFLKLNVRVL